MADVLFVLICLANQTGVDLTDALQRNLEKKKSSLKLHLLLVASTDRRFPPNTVEWTLGSKMPFPNLDGRSRKGSTGFHPDWVWPLPPDSIGLGSTTMPLLCSSFSSGRFKNYPKVRLQYRFQSPLHKLTVFSPLFPPFFGLTKTWRATEENQATMLPCSLTLGSK